MMMRAKDCAAKALEMDGKADECFSAEAADLYRELATQWRHLRAEATAQDALRQGNGDADWLPL